MSQSFMAKKEILSHLFLEIILKVLMFYIKFQLELFSIIFPQGFSDSKGKLFYTVIITLNLISNTHQKNSLEHFFLVHFFSLV